LAVFVDGCFWHGCPDHCRRPATNSEFWNAKLDRNRERDAETDRALLAAGWTVIRRFEHIPLMQFADDVEVALRRLRAAAA
jgi:DNA mismatch endonuclease (patch repair protein)